MPKINDNPPAPLPIDSHVYRIRGYAVMLDSDLAEVYEVTTSQLNQAVARNPKRFPPVFSFQLTENEWDILRSQIVISNSGRGGRRYPPRVFTEHGAVLLSTVLNSDRAVAASIAVVDAFVRFRHVMDANLAFARKLDELAAKVEKHDRALIAVFEELKRLAGNMEPDPPRERIGFKPNQGRSTPNARKKRPPLRGK